MLAVFLMDVIEKVEELEDRVKIHFHFSNGMHIPDEYKTREILYNSILNLPRSPSVPEVREDEDCCPPSYWSESIFIPKIKKTIAYHFKEWQESVSSRMQFFEGGPYLEDILDQSQASAGSV